MMVTTPFFPEGTAQWNSVSQHFNEIRRYQIQYCKVTINSEISIQLFYRAIIKILELKI